MSSDRYHVSLTALAVGVPIVVGATCYYLYYSNRNRTALIDKKEKDKKPSKLSPLEQVLNYKEIGNQNFSRKDYEAAKEFYTKGIDLSKTLIPPLSDEELAKFYQNRAAVHSSLKDYLQVVEDCNKAIELNKNYTKAYIRRAKAYEGLKEYDNALKDAFSATLLDKFQDPDSLTYTEALVEASSKAKAAEAMKSHVYDWPSDFMVKSYFSAFPNDPIREKLGGDPITSSEQLKGLLDEANKPENDDDPLSLLIRASCSSVKCDFKTAQESFEKLLSMDDEKCPPRIKANGYIKKANVIISEPNIRAANFDKDLELSTGYLHKARELDPKLPDVYLHLAQMSTLLEKLPEALEYLDKALTLEPKFHSALAHKLYIEFKIASKGSPSPPPQELAKFEAAIKEYQDAPELRQIYAQILTECNQVDKAEKVLTDLIKKDPMDVNSRISRALLRFHSSNDAEEASNMIRDAIKVSPKSLYAYEILGSFEAQRGNVDEAIAIFEKAVEHSQSESDYVKSYSMLLSARQQKAAIAALGMQS